MSNKRYVNRFLINEMKRIENGCCKEIRKIDIGKGQDGNNLCAYYINQNVPETIVIVGMPHGNEPVGFFFCEEFILKKEWTYSYNYLVIPVLDYDVAVQNIWIDKKFVYERFLEGNYLNSIEKQIEFQYGDLSYYAHHKKFQNLLNECSIRCVLFIHQTPSIYGGYFYTNIEDKNVYSKLQKCFSMAGIPPEIWGQGFGVERKAVGIFGTFHSKNILDNDLQMSSQEYVEDVLKAPFITLEIPFAIVQQHDLNKIVDADIDNIYTIINLSQEIEKLANIIKTETQYKKDFEYWIHSSNKTDIHILEVISKKGNNIKYVDIYFILRSFMLKLSYLAITYRANELLECEILCIKISRLKREIMSLYKKYYKLLKISTLDYSIGIKVIKRCLQIIEDEKNKL